MLALPAVAIPDEVTSEFISTPMLEDASILVSIAANDAATGGDAVAAALAMGLGPICADTFKRRCTQWQRLRAMAATTPGSAL